MVASIATTLIFCSLGMAAVEVRHDVSFVAVARFFSRSHLREPDLSPLIYNPETIVRLAALYDRDSGLGSGGMVYAADDGLRFYPYLTESVESARRLYREDLEIYPRLLEHYFASDLEALLREMSAPAARARLEHSGFDASSVHEIDADVWEALESNERNRLLRRTRRFILAFNPFKQQAYELSFQDKLRFYEQQQPRGRFVGIFEIRTMGWPGLLDDSHARAMSSTSHYLTITRGPDGRFLVHDYHRGIRREHAVYLPPERARFKAVGSKIG